MYKKLKPKYEGGGSFLKSNSDLIGSAAGLISGFIPQDTGVGRAIGGIGKGVAAGAALGPVGMVAGGAFGLLSSLIGGESEEQRQARIQKAELKRQQALNIGMADKAKLAGYDSYGATNQYYSKGGKIKYAVGDTIDLPESEYEVENGEVVQGNPILEQSKEISSDLHLVGGNKHEQGGTDGIGGERVFSDRLKLTKDMNDLFKSYRVKYNATYADAAKAIGKDKAKAEKKLDSKIAPSIKTANRMLEDNNMALDMLFTLQEASKTKENQVQYKKAFAVGGLIEDPETPIRKPSTVKLESEKDFYNNTFAQNVSNYKLAKPTGGFTSWQENDKDAYTSTYIDRLKTLQGQIDNTGKRPIVSDTNFDEGSFAVGNQGAGLVAQTAPRVKAYQDANRTVINAYNNSRPYTKESITKGVLKGKILSTDTVGMSHLNRLDFEDAEYEALVKASKKKMAYGGLTNPPKFAQTLADVGNTFGQSAGGNTLGNIGSWLSKNQGQLVNGISYLSNLNSINKLDTRVKRNYMPLPTYNYVDKSSPIKADNLNTYRIAVRGLTSSSAGVNASNAGALYAQTLANNSQVATQENIRRDAYNESYGQRVDRINYANAMTDSEAFDKERAMLNEKNVSMPLQARNAFLQGYAGNTALTQKNNLDKQRLLLSAYLNDNNGVMSRIDVNKLKTLQNLPIFKDIFN